ncbi:MULTISPECIES: SRPBCC domain-containing protein [Acidianus]|uniref:Carbon monoxide dehydrogenase n=1 Tax=Candidatus Acidianus copahuensis TaxID=1160895 RepID=A0A031LSV0_9CREN|nr:MULTISPECIES: SRPBCC domain-containing protein [Acidianus]EZQ10840.1 carbon monoxide dehydrogenase [Candidatus Acidianus copahuensis]NON61229.1 carbon monoxide dehydrogenase [Acidianus sp. RZ1]
MRYQGSVEVNSSKKEIMSLVNNFEEVVYCFPGIKNVSKEGDSYKVVGSAGIGFIKGEYKASLKFINVTENGFQISAKGNGMNSNVDVEAKVQVEDKKISYDAEVKVSGVLASVGARLMEPALNKMIGELFECIKSKVEKHV